MCNIDLENLSDEALMELLSSLEGMKDEVDRMGDMKNE